MYRVRRVEKTGKTRDIYSTTEYKEALEVFNSNRDNTFKTLSVFDDSKNIVKDIILSDGRLMRDADIVLFKPEWASGDHYCYVVSNIHEDLEICLVTCIDGKMIIPYSSNVEMSMIDVVGHADVE